MSIPENFPVDLRPAWSGYCDHSAEACECGMEIIAALRTSLAAAEARVREVEKQSRALADIAMHTKAQWDMQIAMTVHRLGGMVEGAPTHAGNFLQRVDALRARVASLEAALREWLDAYDVGAETSYETTEREISAMAAARAALAASPDAPDATTAKEEP